MFGFLRGLIKNDTPSKATTGATGNAAEREIRAKEEKLLELRARLTEIFKRNPMQVVGAAFLIEVVPEEPDSVGRADWEKAMETAQSLLNGAVGGSGFIRRVGAIDYFVRFSEQFRPDGTLAGEWACNQLSEDISALDCGKWTIRLSAALPGPNADIHLVLMQDMDALWAALKPLLEAAGVKPASDASPDIVSPEFENGWKPADPEKSSSRNRHGKSSPEWRPDKAWDRIVQMPEWLENTVHRDPAEIDGLEGPAGADDEKARPAAVRTPSATDRVREAEAAIFDLIGSVTVRYQPLWDLAAKKVTAVFAVPALVRGNRIVKTGDDLFGRGVSAAASGELDRKMQKRTWREVGLVEPETGVSVVVPVHFQTMESTAERQRLLSAMRSVGEERKSEATAVAVIVNVPKNTPSSRLGSHAQVLRALVDEVWIEFPSAAVEMEQLNRSDVSRVGFEILPGASEDELVASAMTFVEKSVKKGLGVYARGEFTTNLAQGLPTLGIDRLAGTERLANPADAMSEKMRFDLEVFLPS